MAVLIKETNVPTKNGRNILAGLFCVDHKIDFDRLIFDRRPQDAGEGRLRWARLPHASLFNQFRLRAHECLRGSGEDVSNYFYNLQQSENWWHRACVGRVFSGAEAGGPGGEPGERYHLALCVCAMGDLNAVDIAQTVHERILEKGGALPVGTVLRHGEPIPRGDLSVGVYVDDLVVIRKLLREDLQSDCGPDVDVIDSARRAYGAAGLPRSLKKCYANEPDFVAWGERDQGCRRTCGGTAN
jgi:hypothetical protein